MNEKRSTIYLLAEMGRQAGCSRREAESALLQDCPEEREFIAMVLDELYSNQEKLP
jgi:lambda repressor-like predicted transcriptional regulator